MKHYLLLLATLFSFTHVYTQNKVPRMTKYAIGTTGVSLYLPNKPEKNEISYSPDSSKITTVTCIDTTQKKQYHFDALIVELHNIHIKGTEEDMLINYLDYLKQQFNITKAAGYGKGHTLNTNSNAKGVIDYWEDKDGTKWQVNAWAIDTMLVLLFEYGDDDYPIYNIMEMYKNGVRFPGDK